MRMSGIIYTYLIGITLKPYISCANPDVLEITDYNSSITTRRPLYDKSNGTYVSTQNQLVATSTVRTVPSTNLRLIQKPNRRKIYYYDCHHGDLHVDYNNITIKPYCMCHKPWCGPRCQQCCPINGIQMTEKSFCQRYCKHGICRGCKCYLTCNRKCYNGGTCIDNSTCRCTKHYCPKDDCRWPRARQKFGSVIATFCENGLPYTCLTGCVHGKCRCNSEGSQCRCECDLGWKNTDTISNCTLPCKCGKNGVCEKLTTEGVEKCSCITTYSCQWKGANCTVCHPRNTWITIVAAVVGGSILTTIVAITVTTYILWKRRNIWALQIIHRLKFHEDDDGKQFDAFISYSGREEGCFDHWFVYNILRPTLEDKMGFKLCIHHRDFQPGDLIVNNISWAIAESRRTIMLISSRYIASGWCAEEYQRAHSEMLNLRHKLIPIFLEEPACIMINNTVLKSILKSVTYICWPCEENNDKLRQFWKKVLYSMPKKRQNAIDVNLVLSSDFIVSRQISDGQIESEERETFHAENKQNNHGFTRDYILEPPELENTNTESYINSPVLNSNNATDSGVYMGSSLEDDCRVAVIQAEYQCAIEDVVNKTNTPRKQNGATGDAGYNNTECRFDMALLNNANESLRDAKCYATNDKIPLCIARDNAGINYENGIKNTIYDNNIVYKENKEKVTQPTIAEIRRDCEYILRNSDSFDKLAEKESFVIRGSSDKKQNNMGDNTYVAIYYNEGGVTNRVDNHKSYTDLPTNDSTSRINNSRDDRKYKFGQKFNAWASRTTEVSDKINKMEQEDELTAKVQKTNHDEDIELNLTISVKGPNADAEDSQITELQMGEVGELRLNHESTVLGFDSEVIISKLG